MCGRFTRPHQHKTAPVGLLPALLLNEYQSQQKTIQSQAEQIAALEQRLIALEARLSGHGARQAAHAAPRRD